MVSTTINFTAAALRNLMLQLSERCEFFQGAHTTAETHAQIIRDVSSTIASSMDTTVGEGVNQWLLEPIALSRVFQEQIADFKGETRVRRVNPRRITVVVSDDVNCSAIIHTYVTGQPKPSSQLVRMLANQGNGMYNCELMS